jgi:heme a synthase
MSESRCDTHTRTIRLWLCAVAALVLAMVLVGGATRLTESGLSITEWKPVMGVVPPLSQDAWQAAFEKYQAIPQYREMNSGMSLDEFKTIYWWEWTHRLLGRVVGAAYLLPFLFFLWRGWVTPLLWFIFGLGALQGAVGWWMVASGLVDRVEVSHYRLATHLLLACLIYVALVWTARRMSERDAGLAPARVRAGAFGLLILVLAQIYLGALVAGLRAGYAYNSWPLIDGALVPDAGQLFFITPLWRNVFENILTVQFDHRMLAYLIFIVALLHAIDVARTAQETAARTGALVLFTAIVAQVALGIATLLWVVPLPLALAHQAMAMLVLTVATVHAAAVIPGPSGARNPESITTDGAELSLKRTD